MMLNPIADLQTDAEAKIEKALSEFFTSAARRLTDSKLSPADRLTELNDSLSSLARFSEGFRRAEMVAAFSVKEKRRQATEQ
jgi:hypothetical protein